MIDSDKSSGWEIAFGVLCIPFLWAWSGFAMSKLWTWFLVPLGVPAVGIWAAMGIACIGRLMLHNGNSDKSEDKQRVLFVVVTDFARSGFALAFGYFLLWMAS